MSALIDKVVLSDLARLGQTPAFVERIIGVYLKEANELIEAIEAAEIAGDFAALRDHAHALQGNSANVGALGLRAFARALEFTPPERLSREGPMAISRLGLLFAATQQALMGYLAQEHRSRGTADSSP